MFLLLYVWLILLSQIEVFCFEMDTSDVNSKKLLLDVHRAGIRKIDVCSESNSVVSIKSSRGSSCSFLCRFIDKFTSFFHREGRQKTLLRSSSFLDQLSPDILKVMSEYLDVLSLLNLRHVSRNNKLIFNDDFWVRYNSKQSYKSFNEEIFWCFHKPAPPIKVMLAHYHYGIGEELYWKKNRLNAAKVRLRKAESLGLEVSYAECTLCEIRVPYGKHWSGFCLECARVAWDQAHIQKVINRRDESRREYRKKEMLMYSSIQISPRTYDMTERFYM